MTAETTFGAIPTVHSDYCLAMLAERGRNRPVDDSKAHPALPYSLWSADGRLLGRLADQVLAPAALDWIEGEDPGGDSPASVPRTDAS